MCFNMDTNYMDELSQRLFSYPDKNNNDNKVMSVRGDKYSLRPRGGGRKDDDLEGSCMVVSKRRKEKKEKQKPAPLSKYRRKTANARERSRMREINAAFEALRRCVPHMQAPAHIPTPCHANAASEKLTKITTLRLAMKYISALSAALSSPTPGSAHPSSSSQDLQDLLSDCSDLDCLLLESDGESLPLSDHSLTPDMPEHCLTPVNLSMNFEHFAEHSLSPTFPEQELSPFDTLFPDFS